MAHKTPTLVIYWTDTYVPLTYLERQELEFKGEVISVTPQEILIRNNLVNRLAAIRQIGDPFAPVVWIKKSDS